MWCDEKPEYAFNDPSSTHHFATEATLATNPTKTHALQGTGALTKGSSRCRSDVDRSVLDSMTHLPRDKAAQQLGLSTTTFKKVCRRAGMQGWPYKRRHLLCAAQEGGGSCSCSTDCSRRNSQDEFAASLAAASHSFMMPLRSIHVESVLSSSSSSMASPDNTHGSFSCLDAAAAQTSAAIGLTTSAAAVAQQPRWVPSAEQSCNVVDAVMDYLDTLSSGCTISAGMAAVHHLELEAVVEGADF
ncbi:hypothetical protein T484DRAFT_1821069 [Baffinella frigidus]|nr:hypothetical protein T484DRAFT_1821069 [Cryptophyta sp. CCMP2293]